MICLNLGCQHISILSQALASMNYFDFKMSSGLSMAAEIEEKG